MNEVEPSKHENDIHEDDHESCGHLGHVRDNVGGSDVIEASGHVQVRVEAVSEVGLVRKHPDQLRLEVQGLLVYECTEGILHADVLDPSGRSVHFAEEREHDGRGRDDLAVGVQLDATQQLLEVLLHEVETAARRDVKYSYLS